MKVLILTFGVLGTAFVAVGLVILIAMLIEWWEFM